MKLGAREHVVTAFAESAAGPGWSNSPVWVVVRDGNGRIRVECVQPDEQTAGMHTLYAASQAIHSAMRQEVSVLKRRRKA